MNIVQYFGQVQNISKICRSAIHNLQTRTVIFPDQEKLLEIKTKKFNSKNPQIKHWPCSKYVRIYRRDLYNLETRKKELKRYLRIETDPS